MSERSGSVDLDGDRLAPPTHSRREVLTYARWAAVGIGVAGVAGIVGVALSERSPTERVSRSTFASQVGTTFTVAVDGSRERLTLSAVSGLPLDPDAVDEGRFRLTFKGDNPRITQNTYRFSHAVVRDIDIFVVPTRDATGKTVYEAIFNQVPDGEEAR